MPRGAWTAEALALLGKVPDAQIARTIGVTRAAVGAKRAALEIPAHGRDPGKQRRRCGPQPKPLPAAVRAQLGKMADAALAAQAGMSEGVIRRERVAASIPPFGPVPQRGGAATAAAALPEPTPEAVGQARRAAGHNQAQAAALTRLRHLSIWSGYESGRTHIDPARWELYLLLTGQHPTLRAVPRDTSGNE